MKIMNIDAVKELSATFSSTIASSSGISRNWRITPRGA
jgi:hypothetical protein